MASKRRHQRDRGERADRHRDAGRQAELADVRDTRHVQTDERDDDGGCGDHDARPLDRSPSRPQLSGSSPSRMCWRYLVERTARSRSRRPGPSSGRALAIRWELEVGRLGCRALPSPANTPTSALITGSSIARTLPNVSSRYERNPDPDDLGAGVCGRAAARGLAESRRSRR